MCIRKYYFLYSKVIKKTKKLLSSGILLIVLFIKKSCLAIKAINTSRKRLQL